MNLDLFLANILSVPVLFFGLGLLAVAVRSELEVPPGVGRALSLYLMLAIGFKGGSELAAHGFTPDALRVLGAAALLASLLPLVAFALLHRRLGRVNAAAVAATYGSVSAVTFAAAVAFLRNENEPFGGHMVAALALMESPAILIGLALARAGVERPGQTQAASVWREALLNGPVFLLLGSMLVGLLAGARGRSQLAPVVDHLFAGALAIFLLDLGMVCARRLGSLRHAGWVPIAFALWMPLAAASAALTLGLVLQFSRGDSFLLVVLAASASYIAVPATLRAALPEADPGLYLPMALGLTFPLNIAVGLPFYYSVIVRFWPQGGA